MAAYLPAIVALAVLLRVDPDLVRRRLESREPDAAQNRLKRIAAPLYLLAFMLTGFDHRWGWTNHRLAPIPAWLSLLADAAILAATLAVTWVMLTNRFAARTIRVEAGQEVISTGPYRFVRHPMYSASILLLIAMPIALGSLVSLPVFLLAVPFFTARLLREEKLLLRDLPGYDAYCNRTRYRLIPFVW